MRVTLSTTLPATPHQVWEALLRLDVVQATSKPYVTIHPVRPLTTPGQWGNGEYRLKIRFFGFLPVGEHQFTLTLLHPQEGEDRFGMVDNGVGPLIRRWFHLMSWHDAGNGTTRLTDTVAIQAGPLTPLIWLFAEAYFRHRRRRLRALAKQGFRPKG